MKRRALVIFFLAFFFNYCHAIGGGGGASAKTGSCEACTSFVKIEGVEASANSPTWVLVYDFSTGDYVYGKKKKCKQLSTSTCNSFVYIVKEYLRPEVRKEIGFVAINGHPYRDSITVDISFFNRHMELAGNFMKLSGTGSSFPGGQGQAASSVIATKIALGVHTSAGLKSDISDLKDELAKTYNAMYKKADLTLADINAKIPLLNMGIGSELQALDIKTVDDLLVHKAAVLAEIDDAHKLAVDADIDAIAAKYGQLRAFKKFIFSTQQVKNSDGTKFTIKQFDGAKQEGGDIIKEFNNKGGFKLDFSSGLYSTTLKDYRYTTRSTSVNDTTFFVDDYFNTTDSILGISSRDENQIIREDEGSFSIGVAVYSHFYWRTSRKVNVSLTLGFGVNNDALTNYMLGGSLLLGKEQRLAVSGGAAFGQVERLASGLEIGQNFQVPNNQPDAIPTRKEWNVSWFVGITYNFGGLTF